MVDPSSKNAAKARNADESNKRFLDSLTVTLKPGGSRDKDRLCDVEFDEAQAREFYATLPGPWSHQPGMTVPVMMAARFKYLTTGKFSGNVVDYPNRRKKAIVSVHLVRMKVSHKLKGSEWKKVRDQMTQGL